MSFIEDEASSDKETLLRRIRTEAGKGANFVPPNAVYQNAVTHVKELFKDQNKDRKQFRNVLLFITDVTTGFKLEKATHVIIEELKVK